MLLALDEGTTSARAIVFDEKGNILGMGRRPVRRILPKPGWVEQDPEEIWASQLSAAIEAVEDAGASFEDIAAIGITNQRETTILWDRYTGEPVYNAIVWQCRRTSKIVDELKREYGEVFRERTGLVPDSYFSGPKIKWLLDNIKGLKEEAREGRILFGTVDSYLIWKLSGSKAHVTDYSNASRTMLFNLKKLDWDEELLEILGIPDAILPEAHPSNHLFAYTSKELFGREIPITGDLGDQQAALFGQACFDYGMAKATYGTGTFLLTNVGEEPKGAEGLVSTVAWGLEEKRATYALEGSIFISGGAIDWLVKSGILESVKEFDELTSTFKDSDGVYFVPALVGLGAPYWDQYARGLIIGITERTKKGHIARAVMESMAYAVRDLVERTSGLFKLKELRVDGGVTKNDVFMQFQADVLGVDVLKPKNLESTALGAAMMARVGSDPSCTLDEIASMWELDKKFSPLMDEETRERLYSRWKEAVKRSLGWALGA